MLHKLSSYFTSVWNKFDMLAHSLFIVSVILRFTVSDDYFVWPRMSYCLTLSMYYIRFMQAFYVEKNIGPKVIMVRRMLTDILFFVCILLVFITAYGVASQALRFPNAEPSWHLLKDVVYKPYWQMYGELFLNEIEGDIGTCSFNRSIYADPNVERCPEKSWLAIILFAVYMIMSNVLLLNLLVAMFSYTFERVQGNSEKVWRFYRYSLIHEYFDRPTFAPPLIVFSHIYRVIKYAIRKCKNQKKISNDFRQVLSKEESNKLTAFERAGMENYLLQKRLTKREHIDAKVQSTSERIDKVIGDLEQIKERVIMQTEDPSHMSPDQCMTLQKTSSVLMSPRPQTNASPKFPESSVQVEKRLTNMESQMTSVKTQLSSVETQLAHCVRLLRTIAAEPKPRHSVQPRIEIEGVSGLDSKV
ncbi:Transient receptor potential cation channel subfamily M member-like 2 [Lamellibrachia satsuma]|nr:Transient receptor potential cation channel subfamily M member-like 2 [Lamellibrachia satsuma]